MIYVRLLANLEGNGVIKGQSDLIVLRYMAKQLHLTLHTIEQEDQLQLPLYYDLTERASSRHRVMIFQPQELLAAEGLSFVGFVSAYQTHVDPAIVDELHTADRHILPDLARIPGLLGYSSMELRAGRWYNLVLLHSFDTKADLKQIPIHQHAAYKLAPCVYEWIRIHNGVFPGGLVNNTPELIRTKHYTFQYVELHFRMYEVTYEKQNKD